MNSQWIIIGVIFLFAMVLIPGRSKGANPYNKGKGTGSGTDLDSLSFLGNSAMPRGMRNNNPGNIEKSSSQWKGKVPPDKNTDDRFEQFTAYVWGVRAMIRLIRDTYMITNGLQTIEEIITKYAPGHENDTFSYIQAVSNQSGYLAGEHLTPGYDELIKIIPAMAYHENGRDAISDEMFQRAWELSI